MKVHHRSGSFETNTGFEAVQPRFADPVDLVLKSMLPS